MKNPRWSIDPAGDGKSICLTGSVEVRGSGNPYELGEDQPDSPIREQVYIFVDNDDVWCNAQEEFSRKLLDVLNSSVELETVDVPLVEDC